jgi:muramoyltetrapeptide carboxypeptidase LdcA involved in peptidoglycan recycling
MSRRLPTPAAIDAYKRQLTNDFAKLGLKVRFGVYAFNTYGYLAATDQQRASDVMV